MEMMWCYRHSSTLNTPHCQVRSATGAPAVDDLGTQHSIMQRAKQQDPSFYGTSSPTSRMAPG